MCFIYGLKNYHNLRSDFAFRSFVRYSVSKLVCVLFFVIFTRTDGRLYIDIILLSSGRRRARRPQYESASPPNIGGSGHTGQQQRSWSRTVTVVSRRETRACVVQLPKTTDTETSGQAWLPRPRRPPVGSSRTTRD